MPSESKAMLARFKAACDYPGVLNEAAVEAALTQYVAALGIKRNVVRLRREWSVSDHPALARACDEVLADFAGRRAARAARAASDALDALDASAASDASAARAARDASAALDALAASAASAASDASAALDALAARDARDARDASDRFASWVLHRGWFWSWDLSWLSCTAIGAEQIGRPAVSAWARPVFEAFCAGCWFLFWTDSTLYWVAKPQLHKRPDRSLHRSDGPAVVSDAEDLYFLNGVLVESWLVETPAEQLDPARFATIENAEVRREFVRKVGIERICSKLGTKVLDKQGDYELHLVPLGGATGDWPYLKMRNPSIDVWHMEAVARECRTVEQALRFRNGGKFRHIAPMS